MHDGLCCINDTVCPPPPLPMSVMRPWSRISAPHQKLPKVLALNFAAVATAFEKAAERYSRAPQWQTVSNPMSGTKIH